MDNIEQNEAVNNYIKTVEGELFSRLTDKAIQQRHYEFMHGGDPGPNTLIGLNVEYEPGRHYDKDGKFVIDEISLVPKRKP